MPIKYYKVKIFSKSLPDHISLKKELLEWGVMEGKSIQIQHIYKHQLKEKKITLLYFMESS